MTHFLQERGKQSLMLQYCASLFYPLAVAWLFLAASPQEASFAEAGNAASGQAADGSAVISQQLQAGAKPSSLQVNIRDYGASGDGTTSDTNALKRALQASAGQGILFPPGIYRLTENVNIEANIIFQPGAMIWLDPGKNLTIRGWIEAGGYQIFGGPGMKPTEKWARHWISGVVCNQQVNVKWFGARGDDSTDNTDAIKSAMFSLIGLDKGITKGGTIYFPKGVYRHKELDFGSPFYAHLVYWVGDGSGAANFEGGIRSAGTILKYTGTKIGLKLRRTSLTKLTILTETGSTGIAIESYNSDARMEDITVTGFSEYGLDMSATVSFIVEINKCRFSKNGTGIKLLGNAITISNSDISGNTKGGILAAGGTVQNIVQNTIESNNGYGIRFQGMAGNGGVTQIANIRGNYFEHNLGYGDIELLTDNVILGINVENNYFNGNPTVEYGIYSLRSNRGRFTGNYFNGGHAKGVAHFSGYGSTKNINNTWQHINRSDNRFGDLHGVQMNGWEKIILEKTTQNNWALNGEIIAEAKNTTQNYQNINLLKLTDNQIPARGIVDGIRVKIASEFKGVKKAVAKIGTSGKPTFFMNEGYDLATIPSDVNFLDIQPARPAVATHPDLLTIQISVGDGEKVSDIAFGAKIELWIKISQLP